MIVRRIIRTTGAPAPWSEFANHKCPLFFFQESREEKEKLIWDLLKGNFEEENLLTYFNKIVIVVPPKQEDRNMSKTKEKDKEKETKREEEEAEKAAIERQ